MREQNSGAKVLLRNIYFSLEIVGADEGALLRKRVAGACSGSKFPRVYRPLPALELLPSHCFLQFSKLMKSLTNVFAQKNLLQKTLSIPKFVIDTIGM